MWLLKDPVDDSGESNFLSKMLFADVLAVKVTRSVSTPYEDVFVKALPSKTYIGIPRRTRRVKFDPMQLSRNFPRERFADNSKFWLRLISRGLESARGDGLSLMSHSGAIPVYCSEFIIIVCRNSNFPTASTSSYTEYVTTIASTYRIKIWLRLLHDSRGQTLNSWAQDQPRGEAPLVSRVVGILSGLGHSLWRGCIQMLEYLGKRHCCSCIVYVWIPTDSGVHHSALTADRWLCGLVEPSIHLSSTWVKTCNCLDM